MNPSSKNRLFTGAVVALCVALLGSAWLVHTRSALVAASPAEPAPVTVAYDKDQAIGKLYFSLALLPGEQRKVFYGQFTENQKRAVWSLHLTMTMLDIENPTPAQLAVFQKLALFIRKADFTDMSKNLAYLEEAKAIEAEAVAALGAEGAHTLLNDVGGAVRMKTAYGQKVRFDGACGCNDLWSGYCGDGRTCEKGSQMCETSSTGCGFLWLYACNGLCVNIAP